MIDILIPVLNRPHRAVPLAENIHEATVNEHRIYFLCSADDDDQIVESRKAGLVIHTKRAAGPGDYAMKINLGYRETKFPWIFLGADDLCFCPGWDVHALATAEATGASVIGTDDLGNPTVQRGDHATHLLVRRSYVDERGASWDGPGVVYHEGYDHQFVDSEVVHLAKKRGVWAFSRSSKVEHMHTFWGKSERDATYDKALAKSHEDNRLWAQRRRQYG